MDTYNYLIIGGGMTAYAAIQGIRKKDPEGTIGIIAEEPNLPYKRPWLSKKLWQDSPLEKIWLEIKHEGVHFFTGKTAVKIDPKQMIVTDQDNRQYHYEKLLIATGAVPRELKGGTEGVIYFRNLADYRILKNLANSYQNFLVIGGGFIGSEITAALTMNKKNVTMIFPEKSLCSNIFPADLSLYITEYYKQKGVKIIANEMVKKIIKTPKTDAQYLIETDNGLSVMADGVIVGIGVQPNVDLAQKAGLNIKDGIQVDKYLKTNNHQIFAAGDAANFYSEILDKRLRVEHEDNALIMGDIAGQNMAGELIPYQHLPFFYSDMFELGYEAVGITKPELDVVAEWKEKFKKGIIYYLENHTVQGIVLWNVWDKVPEARKIITEKKNINRSEVNGLIEF